MRVEPPDSRTVPHFRAARGKFTAAEATAPVAGAASGGMNTGSSSSFRSSTKSGIRPAYRREQPVVEPPREERGSVLRAEIERLAELRERHAARSVAQRLGLELVDRAMVHADVLPPDEEDARLGERFGVRRAPGRLDG